MDGPSQEMLIQITNGLANGQTVSELNHELNSSCAYNENDLKSHEDAEIHKSTEPESLTGMISSPVQCTNLPNDASNSTPDKLELSKENQPVKRSRGRPRNASNSTPDKLESSKESQPVKQSRGRPSKTEIQFTGGPRVLRSRSQEKPKVPESVDAPSQDAESREKKRRTMKKGMKKDHKNEFSKIKTHLRYLLNRMSYEQSFIEAYAGEGWKGQSLEKLRPEKELERAKSDINRYKLRIRDLFKQIDTSLEEGRIPESLYDSDGLIDSEDIFCAKCGQTEVRLDNDIILCDGACERGFHQFCLDPPLLKEQVPPGDEGWLCPACNCKVDCVDIINDSEETDLSINDSWEKVFPESVASGNTLDDLGLPSDDSEDDDFNPDGPEEEDEGDADEGDAKDSSSDESDFSSASEDLGAVANNDPLLELPSDDSEDDDFNPDKVDSDGEAKAKSSGSDFTSDSDDLHDISKDEGILDEVQGPEMLEKGEENITKTNMEYDDSGPITAKRHVKRLDYKKLHDEEYGNTSSDSSDEDFYDSEAPTSPKNSNGTKNTSLSKKQKQSEPTPVIKTIKKPDVEVTNSTPLHKDSSAVSSSDKSGTAVSKRRLGEAVTQRLYEHFKENQYPDKVAREQFAKELKITPHQVGKWFENARWNYNHPGKRTKAGKSNPMLNANTPTTATASATTPTPTTTTTPATAPVPTPATAPVPTPTTTATTTPTTTENIITNEAYEANLTAPKSRKRKTKAENHNETKITPSLKEASLADSSNKNIRRSSRVQAKR